ncbi:hypothetical protein JBL43_07725 [Aureibaculum sp. A20]|uniref:Cytochrome c domain-containing protein n=1 Tax=Aureibaculum flavum TaxID=2795986 RepID=A0ABS0WQ67_9FLAO|nr:c-type cytochrome [Aureibaculum flavum]MBJ2174121.1 hypothetical protein [Aureibaculum flavum]
MKNLLPIAVMIIVTLVSCQDQKSKSEKNELNAAQSNNLSIQIELGEKLFNENICDACHFKQPSEVGPTIKNIVETYNEQEKSIADFLQGKVKPIVDTDEDQIAIMQMNIDTFVSKLSLLEVKAIEVYMENTTED